MKRSGSKILTTITGLTAALLVMAGPVWAFSDTDPIPAESQIVVAAKLDKIMTDARLRQLIPEMQELITVLDRLDIRADKVKKLTVFASVGESWDGFSRPKENGHAAPRVGILLRGELDGEKTFSRLRNDGWVERFYAGHALLWWSAGTRYYLDPGSGECVTEIEGYGLVFAGSVEIMVKVLEIASGTKNAFSGDAIYEYLSNGFVSDGQTVAGIYASVPDEMLDMAQAATVLGQVFMEFAGIKGLGTLMDKSGQIERLGALMKTGNDHYLLQLYFAMDSEESASFLSGLLNLSGGLINMLPEDDPGRKSVENFQISRQGEIIKVDTKISREDATRILQP